MNTKGIAILIEPVAGSPEIEYQVNVFVNGQCRLMTTDFVYRAAMVGDTIRTALDALREADAFLSAEKLEGI